ncbi:MAG TPA: carboxypeptidase-like regulatory domain-containing protein [Kofleriaceae bacterium]|jgi:protocatechuate 3,4-dioxygenase beta subunit
MRRRVLVLLAAAALFGGWRCHAREAAPPHASSAVSDRVGDMRGFWELAKHRARAIGPIVLHRVAAGALRLEGLVVDEDQQPIGGALVTLDRDRTTTSEADGSFGFDGVAAGTYRLEAEAAPPDTAWGDERDAELTETSDPITVTVVRGPTLRIRVVDKAGAPIAGAHVETRSREATTDAEGRVSLRAVDAHRERIEVEKAGYGKVEGRLAMGDDPAADVERTVTMLPGARISGTVVDEGGAPVAQANVLLDCGGIESMSVSASDGVWTAEDVVACGWKVTASSDPMISSGEAFVMTDGHTPSSGVVVRVMSGAEIEGTVVDARGAPVAGAGVRGGSSRVETDATGHFAIQGLTPDDYDLFASTSGAASAQMTVHVHAREHQRVQLRLQPSGISGVVVDEAGDPVPDAMVSACAQKDRIYAGDSTDDRGHFELREVPPGDYEIEASRSGARGNGTKLTAHTGGAPLRIVVPSAGSVTGRVLLAGAPVPFFGVTVSTDPDMVRYDLAHPRGVRAPDARFTERNLSTGHYIVSISGPTFRTKTVETDVGAGATVELGDIAVDPGRTVRGHVLDANGQPAVGALVQITNSPNDGPQVSVLSARASDEYNATVGADGSFAFAGLPDTLEGHVVMATRGTERSEPVPFGAADTIELSMHATGTILASVANYVGHPHESMRFSIEHGGDSFSVRVEADGTATVEHLLPGDYTVALDIIGATDQKLTVTAGATANAAFALPANPTALTVKMTGCQYVTLHADGPGDTHGALVSCTDGVATIEGVGPGAYHVCASSPIADKAETCEPLAIDGSSPERTVTLIER